MVLICYNIGASSEAKADYFNYPCQPPGVGTGVDIHIILDASGQFCDGPTEINLSHYHCESGGGGVQGGAFSLVPAIGGLLDIGGFGGAGLGGGGEGCSWRCPDNSLAPAPNPPGAYKDYIDVRSIIKVGKAFCVREGHLLPAGPTSALVDPDEGFPPPDPKPWQVGDPSIPLVPHPPEEKKPYNDDDTHHQGSVPIPEVPEVPGLPKIPLP